MVVCWRQLDKAFHDDLVAAKQATMSSSLDLVAGLEREAEARLRRPDEPKLTFSPRTEQPPTVLLFLPAHIHFCSTSILRQRLSGNDSGNDWCREYCSAHLSKASICVECADDNAVVPATLVGRWS